MTDTDTQPWYRQFWPWFIIALPATAVVASLYTVSLAYRTTDSLVIDAEDGVDVVTEQILAAEQMADALGLVATVSIDSASGAITVGIESDGALAREPAIELRFSHPTDARRDQVAALSPALPAEDGSP
ncbi:MAG: FixH family protein, partial [Pseudomonadota bacterium]